MCGHKYLPHDFGTIVQDSRPNPYTLHPIPYTLYLPPNFRKVVQELPLPIFVPSLVQAPCRAGTSRRPTTAPPSAKGLDLGATPRSEPPPDTHSPRTLERDPARAPHPKSTPHAPPPPLPQIFSRTSGPHICMRVLQRTWWWGVLQQCPQMPQRVQGRQWSIIIVRDRGVHPLRPQPPPICSLPQELMPRFVRAPLALTQAVYQTWHLCQWHPCQSLPTFSIPATSGCAMRYNLNLLNLLNLLKYWEPQSLNRVSSGTVFEPLNTSSS